MQPVPTIPDTPAVGIATKLGVIVAALAPLLGALSTVLDGDQTPEALGTLGVAALALYGVIRGRSDQAAAITEAKGQAHAAAALADAQGASSSITGTTEEVGGHPLAPLPAIYAVPPGFRLERIDAGAETRATEYDPARDAEAEEVAADEVGPLSEAPVFDADVPPDEGDADAAAREGE